MTCACIPNKDETLILQACQLHTAWAKGKYAPTSAYTAPPPDQRSTDVTR